MYQPRYIVPEEKEKVVKELKGLAKKSGEVWLATDEDREGEAISWHLCEVLGLDPVTTKRIVFHEITKPAIQKAVQNPRTVDMNLVNAQQARRILDRIVGFELSPVLMAQDEHEEQPERRSGSECCGADHCGKRTGNQCFYSGKYISGLKLFSLQKMLMANR